MCVYLILWAELTGLIKIVNTRRSLDMFKIITIAGIHYRKALGLSCQKERN